VLLGVWSATGVSRWIVVVANMVAFGLWHVAGAFKDDGFEVLDVVGPALLTVLLLWARLRFRSVIAPAIGHASTNVFGLPR
jgi:membrane protease YdiL (CAAX protease family)